MSVHYEIVIFTAAERFYADKILDDFDSEELISRRFYRDSCIFKDGVNIKDLTKVNKDLSKVIIIDNNPDSYAL